MRSVFLIYLRVGCMEMGDSTWIQQIKFKFNVSLAFPRLEHIQRAKMSDVIN